MVQTIAPSASGPPCYLLYPLFSSALHLFLMKIIGLGVFCSTSLSFPPRSSACASICASNLCWPPCSDPSSPYLFWAKKKKKKFKLTHTLSYQTPCCSCSLVGCPDHTRSSDSNVQCLMAQGIRKNEGYLHVLQQYYVLGRFLTPFFQVTCDAITIITSKCNNNPQKGSNVDLLHSFLMWNK